MLVPQLRKEVLEANLELIRRGLVIYTFGNASGIAREEGLVVIKPSGVDFEKLTPESLVVTDLDGKIVEGNLRPSSDLDTHVALYRAFSGIGGVVHTHSRYATAWAQSGREIPCFGTTHADYYHGPVPLTAGAKRRGDRRRVREEHRGGNHPPLRRDGPMDRARRIGGRSRAVRLGQTAGKAAQNAVLLEEIAAIAYHTVMLNPDACPARQGVARPPFPAQARAGRLLRTGVKT